MKKIVIFIVHFISLYEVYSQQSRVYFTASSNLLFFDRTYPNSDPIEGDGEMEGKLVPGTGLGISIQSKLNSKNFILTDIDFSFKKRDHYFYSGALFFRLDEQLVMNNISINSKWQRYAYKNVYYAFGAFFEYTLDKNQNFSYTELVYSPFNYGPCVSIGLTHHRWLFNLNYQYGIPKVVDYFKDKVTAIPDEFKSFIKLHSLQLSVGYQLFGE